MQSSLRRTAHSVGAGVLVTAVLGLCLAASASASQTIFWGNYTANKISHAPIGEGSGADIPIPAQYVNGPYGTAVDAATGKIYWTNYSGNSIGYANLDGSGAGLLNTSGASIESPAGLAIDTAAGRLYWANSANDTIAFANLNGSGGGLVDTTGASVDAPFGVAVDPTGGRLYWANYNGDSISFANLNGSGGSDLDTSGAPVEGPDGLAVDRTGNRVYWANYSGGSIGYASIAGGAGGQADTHSALEEPAGLAIDPLFQTIYWADEGLDQIGVANLAGGANVPPATSGATLLGVNFPVIVERPRMSQFPGVQGAGKPGSTLTCTPGTWWGDATESFLYRAPQSLSYQWLRNGKPIVGANATTLVAAKVGAYACQVTATNFAGADTEQSQTEVKVNATVGLKKTTFNRRKGTATLRVTVTGAGRLDLFGKGVANVSRKKATGTVRVVVRASGKARIKLNETGKAKVKATISYTPEGGKAIKRHKTIALRKKLKR